MVLSCKAVSKCPTKFQGVRLSYLGPWNPTSRTARKQEVLPACAAADAADALAREGKAVAVVNMVGHKESGFLPAGAKLTKIGTYVVRIKLLNKLTQFR